MINFKISGIAAGAAFILSFLVGLISGAGFSFILFRAFLFGVLFFALACLVFYIVGRFLPELLARPEENMEILPGSSINISLGAGSLEGAFPSGDSEDIDNIESKQMSPGAFSPHGAEFPESGPDETADPDRSLDQERKTEYTSQERGSAKSPPEKSLSDAVTASLAEAPDTDIGVMPDFDSLSQSFMQNSGSEADFGASGFGGLSDTGISELDMESARKPSRKSDKPDFGEFDPEEMAKGIQTLLKKDEKG